MIGLMGRSSSLVHLTQYTYVFVMFISLLMMISLNLYGIIQKYCETVHHISLILFILKVT